MSSTSDRGFTVRAYRHSILLAVLAAAVLAPAPAANAVCTSLLRDGDFEQQRTRAVGKPWVKEGRAGMDIARGLSSSGANNARARAASGWNAIRQRVRLASGKRYVVTGYVRTSWNVDAGYFGFRDANQRPTAEVRYRSRQGYHRLRVEFTPPSTGYYYVFAGFWAPGQDSWIQIDDMSVVTAHCDDVAAEPV